MLISNYDYTVNEINQHSKVEINAYDLEGNQIQGRFPTTSSTDTQTRNVSAYDGIGEIGVTKDREIKRGEWRFHGRTCCCDTSFKKP